MAKRKTRGLYHGYVVIDKPAGMTSHDVVTRVRRLVGEKRVGHAGTLDPAATGVLPIAIGHATRTVEYLSDASKAYVAEITLGVTTDSADGDGTVVDIRDATHVTREEIEACLATFVGDIEQIPPMHSAIKVDGRPLYELARKGESIELDARPVTIHAIELLDVALPTFTIAVECSKGTYIRSLARDIGEALGVGAYMSNLVRVRTGPFDLGDAVTLPELEAAFADLPWTLVAAHPDAAVQHAPAVVVDEAGAAWWKNGNGLPVAATDDLVRVYDADGAWLGIGRANESGTAIEPLKVVVEHEDV